MYFKSKDIPVCFTFTFENMQHAIGIIHAISIVSGVRMRVV